MDVKGDCHCRFEQRDGIYTEGVWSAYELATQMPTQLEMIFGE